jgi:sensor domain CHASE-containing protein
MRLGVNLLIILAAIVVSVVIYVVSGGRAFVFLLPLMIGPLLFRRRT